MRRFSQFACFDWSGQAVARPKGIALAIARAGVSAPALVDSDRDWSRSDVLNWLLIQATSNADLLIGFDFSFALPFADQEAYFPGWQHSPPDAKSLWSTVDYLTDDEPHLSASSLPEHETFSRHFRYNKSGVSHVGDLFEPGLGRLRTTEKICRDRKLGNATSCFNLIGAGQVGKSSLTGMRVLHRLQNAIPVWPFDPIPDTGPVLVEVYTSNAARAAGRTGGTKIRSSDALDTGLKALGSPLHRPLLAYDDHSTDAILTAAWLRYVAEKPTYWHPPALTKEICRTEGWTFGVA